MRCCDRRAAGHDREAPVTQAFRVCGRTRAFARSRGAVPRPQRRWAATSGSAPVPRYGKQGRRLSAPCPQWRFVACSGRGGLSLAVVEVLFPEESVLKGDEEKHQAGDVESGQVEIRCLQGGHQRDEDDGGRKHGSEKQPEVKRFTLSLRS